MKVLLTSDWNVNAVNGVVTSILNLKEELEKRGHEVKLLTLSQSLKSEVKGDIYSIGSISAEWIYHMARVCIMPSHKIIKKIYEWKPDIVHSQCEFSSFFMAKNIASTLSIPLIHTCHTVYEDYVGYVLPFFKKFGVHSVRQIFQFCSRRSDLFIAPTNKVKAILDSYPVYCPIAVLPTGIKISSFNREIKAEEISALRERLGIGKRHILLYLGRLGKEKNVSEILQFYSRLDRDDISLLIVGDGPYRETLEKEAKELHLEKPSLIFIGMVQPSEVSLWYNASDLFVNASKSETQGLTYLEALSSSLPLLVRNDPCLEGVCENGINGWAYNNEEEFRRFIDEYFSSDNTKMKEMARKKAEEFSSSLFAQGIEALYLKEIERKKNE